MRMGQHIVSANDEIKPELLLLHPSGQSPCSVSKEGPGKDSTKTDCHKIPIEQSQLTANQLIANLTQNQIGGQ